MRESLTQLDYCGSDGLSPWRVIVITMLLKRTTGKQVRPVLDELFQRWPRPLEMSRASANLQELIRPLGFGTQRAEELRKMSRQYSDWLREEHVDDPGTRIPTLAAGPPPERVRHFYGCGQYVEQAYRICCRGDLSFEPTDKELRSYREWRLANGQPS